MKLFFEPDRVALIGASSKLVRPGYHLFYNMNVCFGDNFYPVNPNVEKIDNKVCYKSILDVPAQIDCAVVFIKAAMVPKTLEECARKGIKRVIIESAGFSEVGEEGAKLTDRCLAVAKEAGMRLWGPNCMGLINVHQTKVMSFMPPFAWQGSFVPGGVSLTVQSGMMSAGFLTHVLSRTPFGLSKISSIGNKIDVDEVDIMEYLVDDPETEVIAMYLESMRRGREFFELARSTDKPVAVLKGGRSDLGARAAWSHTASLAQDDVVLDSAFRQAGIIRVYGLNELMDVARSLGVAKAGRKKRARVAIITFAGSAGVVSSDDVSDMGMELADLGEETIKKLREVFPVWMEPGNPIDLYPAIEERGPKEPFTRSLDAALSDPGVDGVFIHMFAPPVNVPLFDYEAMGEMIRSSGKPVVVWMLGHRKSMEETAKDFERHGVPVVDDMDRGVRILAAVLMRR